jgi:5-methylcytosine-specific restriction enzyme subunit McrC
VIPIKNIFYLLCYAWDALNVLKSVDVRGLDKFRVADLCARLLLDGLHDLLRRGLDREYVERDEDVVGVRGRIDIGRTVQRVLLPTARTHCRFDDLTVDVLQNRILRATLRLLGAVRDLDTDLLAQIQDAWGQLALVSDTRIERSSFGRIRLHRNNERYRFLLSVCRLVHESVLVEEGGRAATFVDFTREEGMHRVFESFVRRFLQRHAPPETTVRRRVLPWQDASGATEALSYIPQLETDVVLESGRGTLVIDAKYYVTPVVRRFDRETLHAAHVNQIFAYVLNLERLGLNMPVEGLLLYAASDPAPRLSVDVELHGRRIRAEALDLNQDWRAIHRDLVAIVGWSA